MKSMRTEAFLSILTIALAFASGVLVLSIKQKRSQDVTIPVLQHEIQKFKKLTPTLDHFRTDNLTEFIDPQNILPFYYIFDYQEIQSLQVLSKTCRSVKSKRSSALLKVWQWEESRCSRYKMSDDFFLNPPYFHPSGHSFAYLAQKNISWVKDHLNLYHVFELSNFKILDLPSPYKYLVSQDINSMSAIAAGEAIVITDRFVFIDSLDDVGYLVYPKEKWNTYWQATAFIPQTSTSAVDCFVKESSICWNYDLKKAFYPKWNPLLFLLCFSILLIVSIFILLALRVYRRQQEQIRLKFTLEMLAHEIRTPVANLALAAESFRLNFDLFPEAAKAGLLRLFDQIERIKRVAESSRNYLNKEVSTDLIKTKFSEINSLREFIYYTLDAYLSQINLEISDQSMGVVLDPYWTSICIKNLVENAITHGAKPIQVFVIQNEKSWQIEIHDQGTKLFNPMIKGEQSSGFGLGFKIVKNIVPHLHADMQIFYNPTRIKIIFGETNESPSNY